jgi:polar amino acid transport system permease protein
MQEILLRHTTTKRPVTGRYVKPLLLVFLFLASILWTGTCLSASPNELLIQGKNALSVGDIETATHLLYQVPAPGEQGDDGSFVQSRMLLARMFFSIKDYEQATRACREVLTVYPDNPEATNFLASIEQVNRPAYVQFFLDTIKFLPALAKGTVMTLLLVVLTILISPVGGLLIALGRISSFKPLTMLCWFVIWIFRGTPLLLQLFFIYYALPTFGVTLKPITAAIMGLSLNYSAYLAEIIRGAIQSIDYGQTEAAKALGMTYGQSMRRVIIPQTYKRLMPPIGNEFIALIKDTALVSTIAMVELMRAADLLFNTYFNITVLALAAMVYLAMTSVFTVIFEKIEAIVGAYENR